MMFISFQKVVLPLGSQFKLKCFSYWNSGTKKYRRTSVLKLTDFYFSALQLTLSSEWWVCLQKLNYRYLSVLYKIHHLHQVLYNSCSYSLVEKSINQPWPRVELKRLIKSATNKRKKWRNVKLWLYLKLLTEIYS